MVANFAQEVERWPVGSFTSCPQTAGTYRTPSRIRYKVTSVGPSVRTAWALSWCGACSRHNSSPSETTLASNEILPPQIRSCNWTHVLNKMLLSIQ